MNRRLLITLHLYTSAFFAPFIVLVALSGGLYLIGIKGEVVKESIFVSEQDPLDINSSQLQVDVESLLAEAGVVDFSFEYVKVSGNTLYTRPTSHPHYVIDQGAQGVEVSYAVPSLQKRMIELHMGHGPGLFKTAQKVFALGLLFIVLSGLWLGLSAKNLQRSTLLTSAAGTVVFALLVLI